MKHTCCCGASIEVSSMYVTTERIEWDKFHKHHEGCAALRLPDTIRFKLPLNHPLVADHPLRKKCCECGSVFTLTDIHTCGKCYTNFAKAYAKLASDDDGFEKWFTERGIALLASSLDKNISWHRMARGAWDASRKNT